MTEELKPCPFCGRRVEHVSRACNQSATGMTYIVSCFCGGYSACAHQQEDTLEEVVKAWNTRALTAAQPAQAEREAFEAWTATQPHGKYPLRRDQEGQYWADGTEVAWDAWQARASLPTQPAQAVQVPEGWEVASYAVGEITIQRMKQIDGRFLWKIANQVQSVLNKQGEWEWEPMPSSRDDEFLARCRYASLDEVAKALAAQQGAEQAKGDL